MAKRKTAVTAARKLVPYVDHERDLRDLALGTAIRAAINIVGHDDNDAGDLLRLALWKLEASWPIAGTKFAAEFNHG